MHVLSNWDVLDSVKQSQLGMDLLLHAKRPIPMLIELKSLMTTKQGFCSQRKYGGKYELILELIHMVNIGG